MIFSYYFRARNGNFSDYINPDHFVEYEKYVQVVQDTIAHSKYPDLPLWMGEGAAASGGGNTGIADRYAAGFL